MLLDLGFIVFGLIIGSFLNVCIARLPYEESVVFPNSHCPHCNEAIKAFDNVPVLSYLILGGKCRSCRRPISWQYPAVEVLTAFTFWATFQVVAGATTLRSADIPVESPSFPHAGTPERGHS